MDFASFPERLTALTHNTSDLVLLLLAVAFVVISVGSIRIFLKRSAKRRQPVRIEKLFYQNRLAAIHLAFHLRDDKVNSLALEGLRRAIADFKRESLSPSDEYVLANVNAELRRLYAFSMPSKSFDVMFRPGEGWKRYLQRRDLSRVYSPSGRSQRLKQRPSRP
jgi:hypothetical protein